MWMLDALVLVVLPVCAGVGGAFLGSWYVRLQIKRTQYDLAVLEDRFMREVKRRAAEARWTQPGEPPADVEAAVKELRALAIGEEDGKGFKQGKEGGVYRGTV